MTIRLTWARAIAAVVALALAGLAFAWSGLFNVAASSGHWPITDWALHWAMRNSVRTHAAFSAPADPLDRRGLVSAAGHFAGSCAACHGAPGVRPLPVMQGATPPAPDLAINARHWSDRQIFWILDHGVKYTGMPAWPARDRPDEVRRMTAFVRALPTMTPATYRTLVAGPDAAVVGVASGVVARCTGCHGADGRGRGQPDIPVLGGQHPAYLHAALRAYADGTRSSAVMGNAAALLSDGEMRALANHFAAMPGLGGAPRGGGIGQRIATTGIARLQLPACLSCHKPGARSPVLFGQKATYLAQRLEQWRGEANVVDARKPHDTMPVIARRIPQEHVDALTKWLATAR